jgi:hypothetical protein
MMYPSPDTLMRQAPMTVHDYLLDVVRTVDKVFGEGFAARNPVFVASLVDSCVRDFHTGIFSCALGRLADVLEARHE